jgi:ParB-like nuclease domain
MTATINGSKPDPELRQVSADFENGTCPEIFEVLIEEIYPAVINDMIYGAIDPYDESLDELVALMESEGQLDPIVLTLDNVLISGHRRRAAATRLNWSYLRARRHPIRSDHPDFEKLLVVYNAQRDKTPNVRVREQLVLTDPDASYQALVSERVEAAQISTETLALGTRRARSRITKAKQPFLDAIRREIDKLRDHWPLSDRRVHYALLNDPPLIHGSKPNSRYRNDHTSYKATCELLTRARLEGLIPFSAIGDETRPVIEWAVHSNVGPFFRAEVDDFCTGYARDLMQGQPNHIEIVGEKLTVQGAVRPVAGKYCLPYTIGRGYSSLPPRKAMYDRYQKSGKSKLVILFLSDHDPEGWNIPETFSQSMRDDFCVRDIAAIKVGLNSDQIQQLGLVPNMDAKTSSSRFKRFNALFGPTAYELEAVAPDTLERWLDEAVRNVINLDAFNAQVQAEKQDAATITAYRRASLDYLKTLHPA